MRSTASPPKQDPKARHCTDTSEWEPFARHGGAFITNNIIALRALTTCPYVPLTEELMTLDANDT